MNMLEGQHAVVTRGGTGIGAVTSRAHSLQVRESVCGRAVQTANANPHRPEGTPHEP